MHIYIYIYIYINTLSVEALLSHHIRLPFATSNIPGHIYNWRVIDDRVSHGEGRISPATPMNQNNDQPSRSYCVEGNCGVLPRHMVVDRSRMAFSKETSKPLNLPQPQESHLEAIYGL